MTKTNINPSISLIADYDGDIRSIFDIQYDSVIPILPLRNMVLFPGIVIPVSVERPFSLELIKKVKDTNEFFGVVCQKNEIKNHPSLKDLYHPGTIARIVRVLDMPDGKTTIVIQGFSRFSIKHLVSDRPLYMAEVEPLKEILCNPHTKEMKALAEACKDMMVKLITINDVSEEASFAIRNITNTTFLLNFISANMNITVPEKMSLLEIGDEKKRAMSLLNLLDREYQFAALKAKIQEKTREDLDQQQKEFFLQQQIKNLQDELGGSPADQDSYELREKALSMQWSAEMAELFEKEVKKLERLNIQSPDYNVQLSYLQTILSLPWEKCTQDYINIANAKKVLDADHYGLEKVKERILEQLAVILLRNDLKSPIICLYGPPGVGKTSLGKSIARALKRKYVRIALGGVHDESEIRGHRRTYIGAMPGRIIKSLAKCGSSNPVFVLDEIDKISSQNINGDPFSALLEVLDPEQNTTFHDNYLDIDYDLSKVMFIATANSLSTIPDPLRDRMEIIRIPGYITEEKIEIARHFLIPKARENNGLKTSRISILRPALEKIIEQYTRESGVRQLDRLINKIYRKLAYRKVTDTWTHQQSVKEKDIIDLLGQPPFIRDIYQGNSFAGVVTGLAWTPVGGDILFIETSLSEGKGHLTLTGNLGDVMKESAQLALEYIKAHCSILSISPSIFEHWNIHIHVPEGAIPKDGPSAGITIATSIASAITQRKVRNNTAMTGEITLRGKVLPVGGIKEKILAAKRAGITSIILCRDNEKDILEIEPVYVEGLTFDYVETIGDVFRLALTDEKVDHPVDYSATTSNKE